MMTLRVEVEIGGRILSIETGKIARQAGGSALVRYGETVVLCTVVSANPREGIDFFPLTVDYREKMSAAGKFPGGFFKREGRPTQKEILTMRNIDRPARPLFPAGYKDEVQIQCMVLSADKDNDPDILAMNGASAALMNSSIPFEGPTASVRVCRVEGEFVVNPTTQQREAADMELLVAGHKDGVNMIEVGAREVPEEAVAEAIEIGHREIVKICGVIEELAGKVGAKKQWTPPEPNTKLRDKVKSMAESRLRAAKRTVKKQERNDAVKEVYDEVMDGLSPKDADKPEFDRKEVYAELQRLEEHVVRQTILDDGIRPDGRKMEDIRPISSEVSFLPRAHGSSLFTRGETQALVTLTLGTARDEQIIDDLVEEYSKKFMLHYNFPPFSVGEVRRIGSPGRREIGHGALAERALEGVMPAPDKFPYTIRLVSDILESNGSSSMASVCGGTLALMDGGVPIVHPVAGISIGLVEDSGREVLLTDILGEEDHFGDMDFKVAGSQFGITAVQLDLKTRGLSHDLIRKTLKRARDARIHILKEMLSVIREPRAKISDYAPNLVTIKIDPEKIGKVIGPGGAGIRKIQSLTSTDINIEDDGTVTIAGVGHDGVNAAREMVELITEGVKIGRVVDGKVISIKDFGAFIEISPGQDGLCHISELSTGYVAKVTDVCNIGDILRVKVINVDDQGRVKLSRKAIMIEEGGGEAEPVGANVGGEQGEGAPRGHGGERGHHRGGDRGRDEGARGPGGGGRSRGGRGGGFRRGGGGDRGPGGGERADTPS